MAELTLVEAMLQERLNTEFTKEKVAYELSRRSVQSRIQLVSKWAMIVRKMKKQEPKHDSLNDFTSLIKYTKALPSDVLLSTDYISNYVLLLSSSNGREAEVAAGALRDIMLGDNVECAAACVSAGALPALVPLLSTSQGSEAEEAVIALANIASGDAACKAACVSAIKPLLPRSDISKRTKAYIRKHIL
jgi:hypothetical protein